MTAATTRTEALFIGGSADGRRMALDAPSRRVDVPVSRDPLADWCESDMMTEPAPEFAIEEYHRHELRVGGEAFTVYTLGDMSPFVVMQRLMYGYKNKRNETL